MATAGMPQLFCPMVEELGLSAAASLCWDMEVAAHRPVLGESDVWSPQAPLACLPAEDWNEAHQLFEEDEEGEEEGSCCPMSAAALPWAGAECLAPSMTELHGPPSDYLAPHHGALPSSPGPLRFTASPPTSSLGSDSQSEVYEHEYLHLPNEDFAVTHLASMATDPLMDDEDSGGSGGSCPGGPGGKENQGVVRTSRTPSAANHGNGGTSQRRKPGRKKGQVSRVLHLWEFIRDLLQDPRYCPSIIKWENRAQGIFRVVKSAEVARLWGEKKKNKKEMTYEKMSRSLRYSRKEGFFVDIPKESGFPRKLCFKFGKRSYGWC